MAVDLDEPEVKMGSPRHRGKGAQTSHADADPGPLPANQQVKFFLASS